MSIATLHSLIGPLGIEEKDGAIVRLIWDCSQSVGPLSDVLKTAIRELEAYFEGKELTFSGPFNPAGSAFQKQVYAEMSAIPYGETCTYGDIAKKLGVSAQPVGQACGANPIPILIPCHRVVGANGLTGYSGKGGVDAKVKLLQLEGAYSLLL